MNRLVATEQFSSATCNLKCKYCYIPKTGLMKSLQKEAVEKLENKSWLDSLEEVYGKDLEYFGLWGTEPTLTLDKVPLFDLLDRFPKLKEISFSTNLMTNPNIIVGFITGLETVLWDDRKIKFKPQISLDGPAFITDINRVKGAATKIPDNLFNIARALSKLTLDHVNVEFRMKSTLTMDNIRTLNSHPGRIKEYFDYFDTIERTFSKLNKNEKVKFINSCAPTLCVPGKYTSENGKELARFFKKLREMKYPNIYSFRLDRLFKYQNELSSKPSMFTCSGGDSNLGAGIKGDIHICHRSFFFNHPEYIESILSQEDIDNWDVSLFQRDRIDLVKDRFIVDTSDEKEKARFFYVMRNYHDFWRLRISYVVAILKELVLAGQASKCYLDEKLATLFAIFVNTGLSCPSENILNTGCVHFTPVSLLRLFGNGAFEELLRQREDELSRRK